MLAIPVLHSNSQYSLLAVDVKDIQLEAPNLDAKIVSDRKQKQEVMTQFASMGSPVRDSYSMCIAGSQAREEW